MSAGREGVNVPSVQDIMGKKLPEKKFRAGPFLQQYGLIMEKTKKEKKPYTKLFLLSEAIWTKKETGKQQTV
jgi:hypothetical protein